MSEVTTRKEMNHPHLLDAVVWNALTGRQSHLALGNERALRFQTPVAPFAAMADTSPASFDALGELIREYGPAALVTVHEVAPPSGLSVARHATVLQMVWQNEPEPATALEAIRLGENDVPEMMALADATQPGPFGPRTIELGSYLGVRRQGKLAAMAGERMKVDGYTEISAVCVDPAFRGQGLAGGLMRRLRTGIRENGETPFLHVFASNHGAIALYRALGFVDRRELHLTMLEASTKV